VAAIKEYAAPQITKENRGEVMSQAHHKCREISEIVSVPSIDTKSVRMKCDYRTVHIVLCSIATNT
jgi:hypothetical protein